MGTHATISAVRYCDPSKPERPYSADDWEQDLLDELDGKPRERGIQHSLYLSMDGYPTGLSRAVMDKLAQVIRCPHTPAEIAAGAHRRENHQVHWHYWLDDKGQWRGENLITGEEHSLKGWLFGNKGKPLPDQPIGPVPAGTASDSCRLCGYRIITPSQHSRAGYHRFCDPAYVVKAVEIAREKGQSLDEVGKAFGTSTRRVQAIYDRETQGITG